MADRPWESGGINDRSLWGDIGRAQTRLKRGSAIEDDQYEAYKSFNPGEAFKTFSTSALDGARSALADELGVLAGKSAGAGRLNTGFYDLDQGDVARNIFADYGRTVNSAALQTAGMQQQQRQDLLGYGAERNNRYLDLLTANLDRINGQKKKGGGILGVLGGLAKVAAPIAGFALGGPAGAAAGTAAAGGF